MNLSSKKEQEFKNKRQELLSISERLKQIAQELSTLTYEGQKIENEYLSKITNISPSEPVETKIKFDPFIQFDSKLIKRILSRETFDFIAKRYDEKI